MLLRWGVVTLCWLMPLAMAYGQRNRGTETQHFVCHTGFSAERCRAEMAILKGVLDRYGADRLGEWSWVLVRTNDWKAVLSIRGFDTGSPAFTYLPGKETFFDEALTTRDSIRGLELTQLWQMSIDELLDKAVRHELAHAFCKEKDEFRARVLEERLRYRTPVSCKSDRQ